MQYVIGVDIGTQGTKTGLFDRNGRLIADAFEKSCIMKPSRDAIEEDPETQVSSVCNTIRSCIQTANIERSDIAALSIDGQMAGVIGVDRVGKHVTPYDSWLDTRCGKYIEEMNREAGEEIIRSAGSPASINHGPKMLWWMHEQKDVYHSIHAFVQPAGYAAMRLCGLDGGKAFIDRTYLHFTGFADSSSGQWNQELCTQFDFDCSKLPRIVSPHEQIGAVSSGMAHSCGLEEGTPVIAGCGDTAASFLSCGAVKEGICADVAGTAQTFAATTSSFRPDIRDNILGCAHSAVPGLFHLYAYVGGGGMNLEWFKEQVANRGDNEGEHALSLDDLEQYCASVTPEVDNPLFIPHMSGRVSPGQPYFRGAWLQLSWNHTLGHLYRAVLESIALEYRIYLDALRRLYPGLDFTEIHSTGGGSTSTEWARIKADCLQIPLMPVARREGAPLGSAMVAGYGVGLFEDIETLAREWIITEASILPDEKKAALYENRFHRYRDYTDAVDTITRKHERGGEDV